MRACGAVPSAAPLLLLVLVLLSLVFLVLENLGRKSLPVVARNVVLDFLISSTKYIAFQTQTMSRYSKKKAIAKTLPLGQELLRDFDLNALQGLLELLSPGWARLVDSFSFTLVGVMSILETLLALLSRGGLCFVG